MRLRSLIVEHPGRAAAAAVLALALLVPTGAWAYGEYVHYSAYAGRITTHAPFSTRKVALTFDDGPSPTNQSKVLSSLRTYGARATFFLVGNRIRGRSQLRAIQAQGCEIANHTWTHISLDGLSSAQDQKEIGRTDALIYHMTGRRPLWVRSRAGAIDSTGLDAVNKMGRLYVTWDADGQDTSGAGYTAHQIASTVLATTRGGSVILLHETSDTMVLALPEILSGLRSRGYTVTTVSDLLAEP